ncbi:MAG: 30S ribosomal protein S6 [Candidatus Saccharimonas sp.]|jgi:ribosomal protein S6
MREYELTVLIRPDLEANLDAVLGKVKQLIADNGGSVKAEDNWGKNRLAYNIKGEDFAVYVSMDVELPADAPLKISNALNISDEVIRYLLVKIDHKARAALAEAKKRAAERETESSED